MFVENLGLIEMKILGSDQDNVIVNAYQIFERPARDEIAIFLRTLAGSYYQEAPRGFLDDKTSSRRVFRKAAKEKIIHYLE